MFTYFVTPSGTVLLLQDGRRIGDAPSVERALQALHRLAPGPRPAPAVHAVAA